MPVRSRQQAAGEISMNSKVEHQGAVGYSCQPALAINRWLQNSLHPRQETDFTLKSQHFQAAIAIDGLNLLPATVNRKIIQLFWLNPKHFLEYRCFNPAEARAIRINTALTSAMVKINTPAPVTHHTQVKV
jgi:hypothetical protein